MLTISHEFQGHSDYWSGNGRRWDDNAGCLFAHYGPETTLADLVDQWVDDFIVGGDCDTFPESVTSDELRQAIVNACNDSLDDLIDHDDWEDWNEDDESPVYIILAEYEEDDGV